MKNRNPLILVPIFLAFAAVICLSLVQPDLAKLKRQRQQQMDLRVQVDTMEIETQSKSSIEQRIEAVRSELKESEESQLTPFLESYAMRAKALVGGFAEQAGLVDVEFSDRAELRLPVLKSFGTPAELHSRLPVVVSCQGDYAAIVSFILRVEKEFPNVSLGALRIRPQTEVSPDLQRAEIVLEWPVKGASKP